MEIWKDINGYEGRYQVSSLGRVRSLQREIECNGGRFLREGVLLKPALNPAGYLHVNLTKKDCRAIHRLVAETFLGVHEGLCVDHINNVKTDNRVENLQWISHRDNCIKAIPFKTKHNYNEGANNSHAKKAVMMIEGEESFFDCWKDIADALKLKYPTLSFHLRKYGIYSKNGIVIKVAD